MGCRGLGARFERPTGHSPPATGVSAVRLDPPAGKSHGVEVGIPVAGGQKTTISSAFATTRLLSDVEAIRR